MTNHRKTVGAVAVVFVPVVFTVLVHTTVVAEREELSLEPNHIGRSPASLIAAVADSAGTLVPFFRLGIVYPSLLKVLQLEHVEVVVALSVSKCVGTIASLAKQLIVQPILRDLGVSLSAHHKNAFGVRLAGT